MTIKSLGRFLSPAKFATLRYQVVLILFSATFCINLFYEKANEFFSTDPRPEFKILTPESVKHFLGSSIESKVEVGMRIENFQKFDLKDGHFVISAIVWFKFNPSVTSLETIGMFTFEKGEIKKKTKPKTKLVNGLMLARYNVLLELTTNLDHRLFPFNDNRIFITLVNKSVSPGEMIFESYESDLSLSPNMRIPGWKKIDHGVVTGYTEALLNRHDPTTKVFHPLVMFFIDFSRLSLRKAFILLLPLFVVIYILFISLTFSFKYYNIRLSLSTANIAALLGYRFVIERVTPKVGYFMLTDHIFNLFLAMAFFIFLLNMLLREKGTAMIRGTALICLHIIQLSAVYYLVAHWMKT